MLKTILAAVLALSASVASAGVSEVTRSSVLQGDTYVPALMVTIDGDYTVYASGENGLTNSIIFDKGAALAWAEAQTGADLQAFTPRHQRVQPIAGFIAGTQATCLNPPSPTCVVNHSQNW